MNESKPKIDPLYRVFVYNGQRFQTHDGVWYARDAVGSIHRQIPKLRGKLARRQDKILRRTVNK